MGVLKAKVGGSWVEIVGGAGVGGSAFTHHQETPSATWVIVHDLPYQPAVTIVDTQGVVVDGDIDYGVLGTVTVSFSAAFAGLAYLS